MQHLIKTKDIGYLTFSTIFIEQILRCSLVTRVFLFQMFNLLNLYHMDQIRKVQLVKFLWHGSNTKGSTCRI